MTKARRILALFGLLAAWLVPSAASAHSRSVSYSSWNIDGDRATVRVELGARDETALNSAHPADEVAASFLLRRGGVDCTVEPDSPVRLTPAPSWRRYEWELSCPSSGIEHQLTVDLLFDTISGHIHIASVHGVDQIFAGTTRTARWHGQPTEPPVMARLGRYARLGASHVLGGLDHLIFLLVLVVVARSVREVAIVATGFTVGHSITLALAVTGTAMPATAAIEALIGLSIVLVAVDNVWLHGSGSRHARAAGVVVLALFAATIAGGVIPRATMIGCAIFAACYFALASRSSRPARLRVAIAALFGLVHGFGFAVALAGLSGGGDLALPLAGFNLGVELGQLVVIAAAYPLVHLLARRGYRRVTVDLASAGALAAGLFWFLSRSFA